MVHNNITLNILHDFWVIFAFHKPLNTKDQELDDIEMEMHYYIFDILDEKHKLNFLVLHKHFLVQT
jgi:hypothetical protein